MASRPFIKTSLFLFTFTTQLCIMETYSGHNCRENFLWNLACKTPSHNITLCNTLQDSGIEYNFNNDEIKSKILKEASLEFLKIFKLETLESIKQNFFHKHLEKLLPSLQKELAKNTDTISVLSSCCGDCPHCYIEKGKELSQCCPVSVFYQCVIHAIKNIYT